MDLDGQARAGQCVAAFLRHTLLLSTAGSANAGCTARACFGVVVGMAVGAVGFLRVDVSAGSGIAQRVLSRGYAIQMGRVDTRPPAASVVDNVPLGDFAVHREPADTVCEPITATQMKGTVTVSVERALPNPTLGVDNVLRLEPRRFVRGQIVSHKHTIPQGAIGQRGQAS